MTTPSTMPQIIVELGFTAGATTGNYLYLDDTVRGKLDTGTLAPAGITADVSADVRAFTTHRGSSRAEAIVRPEAGTSSTTLKDISRNYDPTNLSGLYVSAGVTQVVPMVIARHRAAWAGVSYSLWHGFADSFQVSYAPKGNYSEVTVTASDGFKVLQANNRAAVGAVGAGEDAGARVTRILNSAGWNASDRVIDVGDTTLQATTLAGDALTELLLVCDSELGEMYIDGSGRFVFRHRNAVLEDTRSNTSQATFGDGAGELQYQDITTEYDDQQLVNQVRIGRVGGTAQQADDAASQTKYLTHTYENTSLLMQSDAVALEFAQFLLFQNKDPELRFSEITVHPQRDPDNLYPQVLGREIGDRITINLRPDNGDAISRDVIIRGITHTVTRTTWETKWALQSATKSQFLVLDHPTLGKLDANALAY